jgi:exopolysaccharide biosynthesis polyprenyl glycosylphosphotransferase
MFKRFNANNMALFLLADTALIQLALLLALAFRYQTPIGQPWPHEEVQAVRFGLHFAVGILGLACSLAASVYNARKVLRWIDELQRVIVALVMLCLGMTGVLYLINLDLPRLGFLYFFFIAAVLLIGFRWAVRFWHRLSAHKPNYVSRILIAGAGKTGTEVAQEYLRQRWPGLKLVGFLDDDPAKKGTGVLGLPVVGTLADATEAVRKYDVDEIIIALPSHAHDSLTRLVSLLYDQPVRVRVVPDLFDLTLHSATVESMGGILLIGLRDPAIDGVQYLVKRLMDILLSFIALIITAPIFLVTAIAIKLEDGGPVFYKAQRVGENGRLFWMWKFRSMVVDAEKLADQAVQRDSEGNIIHKSARDPRVTRVGRAIRRTSIDELPQLVNVLRGDMSMVGPRPELPWMVAQYQVWQRKRFAVPQGMTGWWQINGRSDAPMHLHTEHDLYYIQNYSLWLDIQILWKTLAVILSGKGAY